MHLNNFIAIVMAAGSGQRMGLGYNKLLFNLAGQSVLERSVRCLLSEPRLSRVYVVAAAEDFKLFAPILNRLAASDQRLNSNCINGGSTRTASVHNAVEFLSHSEPLPDFLLIHDGARCLLSRQLLSTIIDTVSKGLVTAPALPLTDSIHQVDVNGHAMAALPRDNLRAVQTPQAFPWPFIYRAYSATSTLMNSTGTAKYTDDISLMYALNIPVQFVPGDYKNIKLTSPLDIILAKEFLRSSSSQEN